MVDKIDPCKLESPDTGGTETDTYPTSADPNEDYVNTRGVVIQNDSSSDENVIVSRDSTNNLTFKDAAYPTTKTLSDLFKGGFGGNCSYVSSDDLSSTTSSTYQDKCSITTEIMTGEYVIFFECDRTTASTNKRILVRLYNHTDSVELTLSDFKPTTADAWIRDVGFAFISFAGNFKTFKLQYCSYDNNTVVSIKNAKLAIWRIG